MFTCKICGYTYMDVEGDYTQEMCEECMNHKDEEENNEK